MLDLRLQYLGSGTFQTTTRSDLEAAESEYGPGDSVRARTSHPRSAEQNAYFHAIISRAWENQRGGPVIDSAKHMKAHVLIHVGHCSTILWKPGSLRSEGVPSVRLIPGWEHAEFTYNRRTQEVVGRAPLSTSKLTMAEFAELIDRVIPYLCDVIVPGTTEEDWAPQKHDNVRPMQRAA